MVASSSPASLAAAEISADETKSTPGSTVVVTWDATVALTRVALDLRHEDAGEPAQDDRPDQRDPERGAQLLSGVLEAARFTASRRVDRRLHHVAELGDDEPHPDAEQCHRPRECGIRQLGLHGRQEGEHCDDGDDEPGPDNRPHREPGRQPRAPRGRQEHRDRYRQHLGAGIESVQAEHQLQVQRDDEEHAHEDQVLGEQAHQPRAKRWDLDQVEVDERVEPGRLAVTVPGHEAPEQASAQRYHES